MKATTTRPMVTGLSPVSDTSSSRGRSPHSRDSRTDEASFGSEHAQRACEKCRSSKRRCDKTLPLCTRCTRLNAKCVYLAESVGSNTGSGAPVVIFQPQVSSNDAFLRGSNPLEDITASQFLSLISADTQLGETLDWVDGIRGYFECVHTWYAVVQRTLFEQQIAALGAAADSPPGQVYSPPLTSSPSEKSVTVSQARTVLGSTPEQQHMSNDLALLIVAMYMITRTRFTKTGERAMFDDMYRFVKRVVALALVESSVPNLELVQCGALLALYEYGHGDSLAAYRTLSQVVAAARVLDVKPGQLDEGSTNVIQGISSPEEEQKSSLWWSLFNLDQFLHRDEVSKHLPFILESPEVNTLLPGSASSLTKPTQSGRFDVKYFCEPRAPPRRRLSINVPIDAMQMESFQLSARIASLLHRALRHDCSVRTRPGTLPPVDSFLTLDEEIRSATMSLLQDGVDWRVTLDCFAMCVSALFTLYLPYLPVLEAKSAIEIKQDYELKTALAALRFAAKLSTDISCKINVDLESVGDVGAIKYLAAPAAPTCYLVVRAYVSLRRIFPEEWQYCQEAIIDKYESLRFFSYRWGIAEKMMRQLQEVAGLDRSDFLKPDPFSPISMLSGPMDLS